MTHQLRRILMCAALLLGCPALAAALEARVNLQLAAKGRRN